MSYVFLGWLILTVLLNAYICWRWVARGFLNLSLKTGYFLIAVGGVILLYHRFILHLSI